MKPSDILTAEAFKRLYPDKYCRQLLGGGYRPDGRPLGAATDCSIGLNPVSAAASSALVKIGNTMVMSGTRLKVSPAEEGEAAAAGAVTSRVELLPLCAPSARPGRSSDEAQCLTAEVSRILKESGALRLEALLLEGGKAAWQVTLDVCVLEANGSLLDACLLAAVSALAALRIPQGRLSEGGKFVPASGKGGRGKGQAAQQHSGQAPALLDLQRAPYAHTCCWHSSGGGPGPGPEAGPGAAPGPAAAVSTTSVMLRQPSEEEERLAGACATVVCDASGDLLGVEKWGALPVSDVMMAQCLDAAAESQAALAALLAESLSNVESKVEGDG